jgi:hypothetical protein
MRTHTLFTKCASIAVCFGVLLSGPVMAGTQGIIKDVELTSNGVLYGQISTSQGKGIPNAVVHLRHQGAAVATAKSNAEGRFAISGVRGGAHEVVVGAVHSPVRLWSAGAAPKGAMKGIVVAAEETIIRGQNTYCDQCPPGGSCDACMSGGAASTAGFGMLDVITLATVGAAVGALVVGIDNKNKLDDLGRALPASP